MNQKISVIAPVYNESKVIEKFLQSISLQSYPNMELILVDDGSTDETAKLINQFVKNSKNKFLKISLFTQNHKGPGPARNLGARNATGQVLVFVDADMTFDKNFIKELTLPIISGKVMG